MTAPISELRIEADGAVKLKIVDKLHAIDSLVKTLGGFAPEKHLVDPGPTLEQLIALSMRGPDDRHGGTARQVAGVTLDAEDLPERL